MNSQRSLTRLQRLYFWAGVLLPLPSICLYVFSPSGTVKHFGGTSSPSADFWCTLAASGDAWVSIMFYSVLKNPSNLVLRQSVLWGNAIYSLFHFGGFLRAHYKMEPHPSGPYMYIGSIIISWAAYLAWGRRTSSNDQDDGSADKDR